MSDFLPKYTASVNFLGDALGVVQPTGMVAALVPFFKGAVGDKGDKGEKGDKGSDGAAGALGDLNATHQQGVPADVWQVVHNLGKWPSVTVIDSAGDTVEGSVHYIDTNNLSLTFTAAFAGTAFLN